MVRYAAFLENWAKSPIFSFSLPVLAGVFLALSFPPGPMPWLIFAALLPLFLFLDYSSSKQAFWGAWLAGFIFIGWSIQWFFAVLPLTWLGIQNQSAGFALTGLVWLLSAMVLSVFVGIFGWFWHKIPTGWSIIIIPSLWIVLEYARAWFFGIFWMGPESLLGPHWTFGSLGYAFANFPVLLQSSKLFGLYGAGFMIFSANVYLYKISRLRFVLKELTAGAILLAAVLLYGARYQESSAEEPQRQKKVALIQTDFPRHFTMSVEQFFNEIIQPEIALLEEAARRDPDLVVLPEGSGLSLRFEDKTPLILSSIFGQEKRRTIIDSSKLNLGQPSQERIFYYDTVRGLVAIQDKELLIPVGEFLPYLVRIPASAVNLTWLREFDGIRGTLRGEKTPVSGLDPRGLDEGTLLCSAILSPSLWRELSSDPAKVLINSASQSIFRGNSYFYGQAEAQVRFFAAANDRWFLQAANGGFSYVIDNRGEIRAKTPQLGNTILSGAVEYRDTKPLYVKFGDWPVWAAGLALLGAFFLQKLSTRKQQEIEL